MYTWAVYRYDDGEWIYVASVTSTPDLQAQVAAYRAKKQALPLLYPPYVASQFSFVQMS